MNRRGCFLLSLLLSFFAFNSFLGISACERDNIPPKKSILILHSYHPDYEWTSEVSKGLHSVLEPYQSTHILNIEYMDANRHAISKYYENLYHFYCHKFYNSKFDVIISTDNDALNFLLKYGDDLFPDTPIVFCGVNNFSEEHLKGRENYYGIAEEPNIKATLDAALKLHPDTRNICFIVDNTTTGFELKKIICNIVKDYGSLQTTITQGLDLQDIIESVKGLPPKSIVFLSGIFKDGHGRYLPFSSSVKAISDNSKAPIYSSWKFFLDYGVSGGFMMDGFNHGKKAAEIAFDLLKNKQKPLTPVVKDSDGSFVFDYAQLKRYKASIRNLPSNSIILNNESSFYKINKSAIWTALSLIFLTLAVSNILLMINFSKRRSYESKLLETGEMIKALINGTPDLICFKDGQGRLLEVNDKVIETFNLNVSDYKEKTASELAAVNDFYKEHSLACQLTDDAAWEKGSTCYAEIQLNIDHQGVRVYDTVKTPLFNADGTRKGLVVIGREITERKAAEEALQKSEKMLRATISATDNGILVVDNKRSVIEYNELFLKMWNIPDLLIHTKEDIKLVKHALNHLVKPDAFEFWVEKLYCIPETEKKIFNLIDGRVYEIFSAPLMKDQDMMGRIWSFRDITIKYLAEKELKESEERYRAFVEFFPDAVFMTSEGKITFANQAALNLVGQTELEEVIGLNINSFLDTDISDKSYNGYASFDAFHEKVFTNSKGFTIDVEINSTRFPYGGNSSVMSVVRDISERKRAEELNKEVAHNAELLSETIEYDKLKTEFFANISHELRTPLNIILGVLQLFNNVYNISDIDANKKSAVSKYMGIMKQNCFRLLRLVNNLIDITKIDSGFFTLNMHNINIVSLVEDITLSVVEYVENKGISLQFDTEIEEKIIACDPDKIERILLNLLSNAFKFTKPGGNIDILLSDAGDSIEIVLSDNGIGIPEEKKDILFKRFRQVDKSFTRESEGSGIGLSLVKSLVELHGGSIGFQSIYGQGTSFTIKLPAITVMEEKSIVLDEATKNERIQRINIEFSDIYFNS